MGGRRLSRWVVASLVVCLVALDAPLADASVGDPVQAPEAPVVEEKPDPAPVSEERDLARELSADAAGVTAGQQPGRNGASSPTRVAEVESVRSEGSETWTTADGAFVTEFFGEPKWFRSDTDEWERVDPAFVEAKGGVVSSGVGFDVTISAAVGVQIAFEGRELQVRLLDAGAVPEVDVKDPKVVWLRDVAADVDLRYTISPMGLKEDFVLRSPAAEVTPELLAGELQSEGALVADERRPGGVVLDWDGDGKSSLAGDEDGPKIAINPPIVTASDGMVLPEAKAKLAFDPAGERTVEKRTRDVGVSVDLAALKSLPAEKYPVTIDPLFEIIPATMGGTWGSYNSAGNLATSTNQWGLLGNWRIFNADDYWRFVIQPGYQYLWQTIAPNPKVFSANLKLVNSQYPAAAAPTFDTQWSNFPTTGNTSHVTACYATAYSYAGAYPGLGGTANCRDGYYYGFSYVPSDLSGYPGQTLVDVTHLIRPWVANKTTFGALGVSVDPWAGVYDFHATVPSLEVVWDQQSPASALSSPTDGATITSTTPTLSWGAVTDPDSGQNPAMYKAVIFAQTPSDLGVEPAANCGGNSAVWSTDYTQSMTSVAVPAGVLQDGVTYSWTVATMGYTLPGYPTCATPRKFKVDRRLGDSGVAPMHEAGPLQVNLASGNVMAGAGSHTVATVGGDIGMQFVYNSQAKVQNGLRAEYFGGTHPVTQQSPTLTFNQPPFAQHVDQKIDFDWGANGPLLGDPLDNFLARWTGYVTVPTAGSYCFGTYADDGTKVTVGGVVTLNNWVNQTAQDKTCTTNVTFAAGETKSITVEYYDRSNAAVAKLKTFGGPTGTGVVPTGWLTTDVPVLGPGWTMSDGSVSVSGARVTGAGVTLTTSDGATVEYKKSATGAYVGPEGDGTVVRVDPVSSQITVVDDGGVTYTYAADGLLISAVSATDDRSPAATQYTWSGGTQKLTRLTDPVSSQYVTLSYGGDAACTTPPSGFAISAGLLCKVASWDGRITDLFYNQGRLERIVNPGGVRTEFTYDANNQLTSLTEPLANDATDATGTGKRIDDASVTWEVGYTSGKATLVTAPAPTAGATRQTHTISYDSQPTPSTNGETRVTLSGLTNPNSYTTKALFDDSFRLRQSYDVAGFRTVITYDGTSDRVSRTDTMVGTTLHQRSSTIYDTSVVFNGLSRPVTSWGPAPVSMFQTDSPLPTGSGAGVPRADTVYDGSINGLQAAWWDDSPQGGETYTYPARPAFRGAPKLHTLWAEAILEKNWVAAAPHSTLPVDNFSLRLTGLVNLATAGTYQFGSWAAQGTRVIIDDKLLIDAWNAGNATVTSATQSFTAGWHRITVEMKANTGNSAFNVTWKTPGSGSFVQIPLASLKPDLGLVTSSTVDPAGINTTTTTAYTDPLTSQATSTTVDPSGLNLTSTTTYETRGTTGQFLRRTGRTLPAGANTTNTYAHYAASETPAAAPDSAGTEVTVANTDQRGLPKTSTAADPDTTGAETPIVREQRYDSSGRVVASRVVAETEWSCTHYDSRGRPDIQTIPGVGGASYRWISTIYAVDVDPSGAVDIDPFVSSVTDSVGTITTRVDLLGRVTDVRDVWGVVTHTDYDLAGRPTQTTVFKETGTNTGTVIERAMSDYATTGTAVNSLSATRWSSAAATVTPYYFSKLSAGAAMPTVAGTTLATLHFDTVGRNDYVDYSTGVRSTTTFDTFGREAGVTHAKGATTLYSETATRDILGRVIEQSVEGTDPNPSGSNYTYDKAGRLTDWWVRDPAGGSNYHGTEYYTSYPGGTPAGCSGSWFAGTGAGKNSNRLAQSVQVNGGAASTRQFCYDHADRIRTVTTPAGTPNPYAAGFTYDAHGNATVVGTESRIYDGADRHIGTTNATTPTALLVVGDPAVLTDRDTWMRQRLLDAGWSVTVDDDDGITAADATGKQLVVVTDSVVMSNMQTTFTNVAVPVLMTEVYLYPYMGMTGSTATEWGSTGAQTQQAVTAAGAAHTAGRGSSGGERDGRDRVDHVVVGQTFGVGDQGRDAAIRRHEGNRVRLRDRRRDGDRHRPCTEGRMVPQLRHCVHPQLDRDRHVRRRSRVGSGHRSGHRVHERRRGSHRRAQGQHPHRGQIQLHRHR